MRKGPVATDRDLDALKWIAEQYTISLDHLAILLARLGDPDEYAQKPKDPDQLTEARAMKIVRRWEQMGLISRGRFLYGDPLWLWLTPEGLKLVAPEAGEFRNYTPTAATINHLYWINQTRLHLEGKYKVKWTGEREVRASLKTEMGAKHPHVPDAIVEYDDHCIAIEVELSTKTYSRLDKILHELSLSTEYDTIWYFVRGRARAVIEKALANMREQYGYKFVIYDIPEEL